MALKLLKSQLAIRVVIAIQNSVLLLPLSSVVATLSC